MSVNTLLEMCELIVDCPHSTPKWTDSGFTVLRNQAIKKGSLNLSECSFTDELNFKARTKRAIPRSGDIVITREAPMGEVCKIPDNLICCLGQRQVLLRPKHDVDADYLLYVLQSKKVQEQILWNEGTGSTVSNLRIPVLEKLEIPRFGRFEKNIGEILKSLDDKIHLNNQINQTLESIAQAIFRSWFIDFEPVRAKIAAKQEGKDPELAAMCTISGKSETELEQMAADDFAELQATAALFPDELGESELGEVPRGWDAITLGNFLEIKRGGSPRPIQNFMAPTGYPWVKIADATADPSPFLFKTKEFIIKEGLRKTVYLKKGSLILTNSATPGLPKFLELDACIHDGWLYFPQKKHFSDNYLYFLFLKLRTQLVAQGNGSVFTNLKTDILRNQVVLVPTKEVIEKFDFQVGKILEMMKTQCIQSSNLSDLRDTLLPKLLSGKVSVLGFQGEVA